MKPVERDAAQGRAGLRHAGSQLGSTRRRSAAAANYRTTTNLEKRQSLTECITEVSGRQPAEFIVELPAETTVLDLGCGNGVWLGLAADRRTAVGLDVSPAMAVGARDRLPGASVVAGDVEKLPFVDGCADAALMLWMLYHVDNKDVALREVARVLRPGGLLIASTNDAFDQGAHVRLIARALSGVLGRRCDEWIEKLDFHCDNGGSILGRHFASVESHASRVSYQVHEPGPIVAYLDSLRDPVEAQLGAIEAWDDVLDELHRAAATLISEQGAIEFERRFMTFLAHPDGARGRV